MHVLDSLNIGGAERVAVNLANLLPRDLYEAHLCTTHSDGPLATLVAKDVHRVRLERKHRFDLAAVRNLVRYIRDRNIQILHAHGTSLFLTRWASYLCDRGVVMIWHDHYGRCELNDRQTWLYGLATRGIGGIIAVSESLAAWARRSLPFDSKRVWYIPNFIEEPADDVRVPELPGEAGTRIVCVANFRPQKDHVTLLHAMARIKRHTPKAHLLLVGDSADPAYVTSIRQQIVALELHGTVTYMGPRQDVAGILRGSDVAVLSSISEGLPLALLEYGAAGPRK
jgi:glycosyltransferase involved in cell wall biosynthesis